MNMELYETKSKYSSPLYSSWVVLLEAEAGLWRWIPQKVLNKPLIVAVWPLALNLVVSISSHWVGNKWLNISTLVRIPVIYEKTVLDFGVLAYSLYPSQQSWKWNLVSYLRRWRLSKIHSCIGPICWVPVCTRECAVPGIPVESRMSMSPVLKELTSRVSGQVDRRV